MTAPVARGALGSLNVPRLLSLATLLVAACGDSTGVDATLDGEWAVGLVYGIPSMSIECAEGGSARLTQSGTDISGTYSTNGNCSVSGASTAILGDGTISGRVSGSSVTLVVDGGCTFDGTVTRKHEMSGILACPLELDGQQHTASGTWQAVRLPRDRDAPPG